MADHIKITPQELQAQAAEMKALSTEFQGLFAGVTSVLQNVNISWSPNLSNNFLGKITSAQKGFANITMELQNGSKAADTCAVSFATIDSELSKMYGANAAGAGGGFAGGGSGGGGGGGGASFGETPLERLWRMMKEEVMGIPEDMAAAGDALGWIEDQLAKLYGKLPDWAQKGGNLAYDLLVPDVVEDVMDAYEITSKMLQGEFTLKDGWETLSGILSKNTKLAVICETFNYTFEKGQARSEEMEAEMFDQFAEGDILGGIIDGAEGFIDTIIGGTVEVLGDVAGGVVDSAIDNIPVVKGINIVMENVTGWAGMNDGEGYSVGGLIGGATEVISDGLDKVTDAITDTTDQVTSAVTKGVKSGIKWVKSWFD